MQVLQIKFGICYQNSYRYDCPDVRLLAEVAGLAVLPLIKDIQFTNYSSVLFIFFSRYFGKQLLGAWLRSAL